MALCKQGPIDGCTYACGGGFTQDVDCSCVCLLKCEGDDIVTDDCTCKSCDGNITTVGNVNLACHNLLPPNVVQVLNPDVTFHARLNNKPCTTLSYTINGAERSFRELIACSLSNEYVVEMKLDCDGCKKTHTFIKSIGANGECCLQGKSYRCDVGVGCTEIDGQSGYPTMELCQANPGCDPCKLQYTDLELGLYDLTCQECIVEGQKAKLQYTYNDNTECCQLGTVKTIGSICTLPGGGEGTINEFCNCTSENDSYGMKYRCVSGIGATNNASQCLPSADGIYLNKPDCCAANPYCCSGYMNPDIGHRYSLDSTDQLIQATAHFIDCNGVAKQVKASKSSPTVFFATTIISVSDTGVLRSYPNIPCGG